MRTRPRKPVPGSGGSPSESKPNSGLGALRRGPGTPKQHFLSQHWGRGDEKQPLRVSAACGHLHTTLHTHSPSAAARARLHNALSSLAPAHMWGSRQARSAKQVKPSLPGPWGSGPEAGLQGPQPGHDKRQMQLDLGVHKANQTIRGQGKVSSAEPQGLAPLKRVSVPRQLL